MYSFFKSPSDEYKEIKLMNEKQLTYQTQCEDKRRHVQISATHNSVLHGLADIGKYTIHGLAEI